MTFILEKKRVLMPFKKEHNICTLARGTGLWTSKSFVDNQGGIGILA